MIEKTVKFYYNAKKNKHFVVMKKLIALIISFLEKLIIEHRSEGERVSLVLKNIKLTDPTKRETDKWDLEFKRLVPVLHNYSEALYYLNRYSYLAETYFTEIVKYEPDKMMLLQNCICRVSRNKYTDRYICKYPSLMFGFLQRWDLLPEIKKKMQQSPEYYKDLIDLYNMLAHQFERDTL